MLSPNIANKTSLEYLLDATEQDYNVLRSPQTT